MQFPIGLYQRSERVVAISAVGQRAKAVEPCHLSCGTDLEHHAAAGAVPIVTVGTTILGGSVEVSVNALNESHTPGKFAIHPLKLARVVKVCALSDNMVATQSRNAAQSVLQISNLVTGNPFRRKRLRDRPSCKGNHAVHR
jgi:hypothetical protein